MSPSPITATVDPTWTSARRQPFSAIAPRVANAASSARDAIRHLRAEKRGHDVEL